jgi:post-segregation antitoxin (ccd killing protein)
MSDEPGQQPAEHRPQTEKAQFNVYLPKDLIRRAKYASVDTGQSLSRLVEDALTAHLDRLGTEGSTTS